MAASRVYESDDDKPVPHDRVKTLDCATGIEKLSTTKRLMKSADENKIVITLVIMIITFIATSILGSRDSTMIHEYRINAMEEDIKEIKADVKSLLPRVQN